MDIAEWIREQELDLLAHVEDSVRSGEFEMIEVPRHRDYSKNAEKCTDNYPCCVCGKPCNNPVWMIHLHYGGGIAVTEEEAKIAEVECPGGDLAFYPIGANCLKAHPELQPYAVRWEKPTVEKHWLIQWHGPDGKLRDGLELFRKTKPTAWARNRAETGETFTIEEVKQEK